jgi:hypothetical protein
MGDAGERCATTADCDDQVFCNGRELCQPGSSEADERGCIGAVRDACFAAQLCNEVTRTCATDCVVTLDADGDGVEAVECGGADCDDANAARYPGHPEVCDTSDIDEDCDPRTFGVRDQDGDAYPDALCCNVDATTEVRTCGGDCDDTRSGVHPSVPEVCNGTDDDCDTMTDEDVPFVDYYTDADGDGYGALDATPLSACSVQPAMATNHTDCDDASVGVRPGQTEVCNGRDDDCNGLIDDGIVLPEVCNGLDDNCNGQTDEGLAQRTYYLDSDDDGFGDSLMSLEACGPTTGYATTGGDCDDSTFNTRPGATELCDGEDNNCNTVVDEGVVNVPWYVDADGDGYGDGVIGTAIIACSPQPGRSAFGGDCVEANATIHPGAMELCDRLDNTCAAGGGVRASEDQDNDGHAGTAAACSGGPLPKDDCADADPSIHPGAPELCNRIDDVCATGGGVRASEDQDNDGYAATTASCTGGPLPRTDCADMSPNIHPGATERCNRIDDVCATGGGVKASEDQDNDGYAPTGASCTGGSLPKTDCADNNPSRNPGVAEVCDVIDNNCSGGVDEEPAASSSCTGANWCETTTGQCDRAVEQVESAAGGAHACVRWASGRVSCWGANAAGTACVAQASLLEMNVGGVVSPITDAVQLTTGASVICVVRSNGQLFCQGNQWQNALGNGVTTSTTTPTTVRMTALGNVNITDACHDGRAGCVIHSGGRVSCFGRTDSLMYRADVSTAAGLITDAVQLECADETGTGSTLGYACVRRSGGVVSCWGRNSTHATLATNIGLTGAVDLAVTTGPTGCIIVGAARNLHCWNENAESTCESTGPIPEASTTLAVGQLDGAASTTLAGILDTNGRCVVLANGRVACRRPPASGSCTSGGGRFDLDTVETAAGTPLTGVVSLGRDRSTLPYLTSAGPSSSVVNALNGCALTSTGEIRCFGTTSCSNLGCADATVGSCRAQSMTSQYAVSLFPFYAQ